MFDTTIAGTTPRALEPAGEPPSQTVLRFGESELRMESRQILRNGTLRPIDRLTFELAVHLIVNRGRVVPKHELLREVWGDMTVSNGAIAQAIRRLRRALGDGEGAQAFIRNVHGVGYRFDDRVAPTPQSLPDSSPAPHLVLSARPASLDTASRQLLARAAGIVTHELARIGVNLRRWESGDSMSQSIACGMQMRLEFMVDARRVGDYAVDETD